MGDRRQAGEPFQYVTSYSGQLSLAIHSWIGAFSTSESRYINTGIPRDVLALCPWSCSVNWCLAKNWGDGDHLHPMGLKAQEGLYFFHFRTNWCDDVADWLWGSTGRKLW